MNAKFHPDSDALSPLLVDLTALEAALHAEADAIRGRRIDALAAAVADKQSLLAAVTSAIARPHVAAALEARTDRRTAADPTARAVLDKLHNCRALNEVSGGAIAGLLQTTRSALNLLGATNPPNEYDGTGQDRSSPRHGRAIAIC